jgi:hypothetical protein
MMACCKWGVTHLAALIAQKGVVLGRNSVKDDFSPSYVYSKTLQNEM